MTIRSFGSLPGTSGGAGAQWWTCRNTNVTVAAGFIGASNREDVIDPEILRPGWLDVKIRIGRPGEHAARGLGVFWQSTSSATFRLIRTPYNQIITW
jgi:hypothetical protein